MRTACKVVKLIHITQGTDIHFGFAILALMFGGIAWCISASIFLTDVDLQAFPFIAQGIVGCVIASVFVLVLEGAQALPICSSVMSGITTGNPSGCRGTEVIGSSRTCTRHKQQRGAQRCSPSHDRRSA